jgi:hypothetical protein
MLFIDSSQISEEILMMSCEVRSANRLRTRAKQNNGVTSLSCEPLWATFLKLKEQFKSNE